MKVIMVTHNNCEMLALALHNIFQNIDVSKNRLIVCDNSTEFQATEMLKELGSRGYLQYLPGVQDRNKRGSVNHRNGLLKCLAQCKEDDRVLILDCDAFPVTSPLSMMNRLKGKKKIIGSIHPRGYVHPSILAGYVRHIEEILEAERAAIELNGKHIDVFESCPVDKNVIKMKEVAPQGEELWNIQNAKMEKAMCRYTCGSGEFYHMWYFTRTNGYHNVVDDIDKVGLAKVRAMFNEKFLNDVTVIIPTYGVNDKNLTALKSVIDSFNRQAVSDWVKYCIVIATYNLEDHQKVCDYEFNCNELLKIRFMDMAEWSRGAAFNRAVIALPYAKRYVFHDRDIIVPTCFLNNVANCPYPYAVNYRSINCGGTIELNSVGGSNTITWAYLLASGGMCSSMRGWGAEDREFDDRVSRTRDRMKTGRRLDMSLLHISHDENPNRPEENQRIKARNAGESREELARHNYMFKDYQMYWGAK